jgi:hypothetical protein
MRWTRLGHLALHKGEGEGEGPVPARRLEHFEVVFFGSKTPSPYSSPLLQGERPQNLPVWVSVAPASTRSSLKFR